MTFLWRHQMGTNTTHKDAKSDATQHAPTHTNTPASIRFQPHPQNCNQTPFRGASGSILKILCILKLPNKKEKFVFIIQNSFQLSRRDCEVFNKQNSAAALGRGRNTTTLLHSSNKRTKAETENCSRGRAAQVYTGQIGEQTEKSLRQKINKFNIITSGPDVGYYITRVVTRDMIVTLYNNHNTNSDVRCELRQPDIICCWGARDEESEYSLQLIYITAVQTRA